MPGRCSLIRVDRDRFLEEGFLILRGVIPPRDLEALRRSYEILVDRQRRIWTDMAARGKAPADVWRSSAQPRLNITRPPDLGDRETAPAFEFWLHENTQGVSSVLLAEDDAPPTEMMLMCNPVSDRGPARWHRDFYPPLNCPLMAYADDIKESGPRYVQWNVPLYDDAVLWVVPGSHVRSNTPEENTSMAKDPRSPVPGGVQTRLQAGDGVVYILPILHWGSNYSTKLHRTIHGGFARLTHWHTTGWIEHLAPAARDTCLRWHERAAGYMDHGEAALRVVLAADAGAYRSALDALHPGRGEKGVVKSTICLSKTARHIYNQRCVDPDGLTAPETLGIESVHPMTLQWGRPLGERFSPEEAEVLWTRFKPVDDLMQSDEDKLLPGFQGGETCYHFEDVPPALTPDNWYASWTTGRIGNGAFPS